MKKLLLSSLTVFFIAIAILPTGCTKSGSGTQQLSLPDIFDFRISSATPFAAGTASTVYVTCTSIGSGTYKVHYDLAGSNTLSAQTSTLTMNGGYGSFKTAAMPNAGLTYLTLNSVTNINGGGTAFINNNKYTLSDSTGELVALIGGTNIFKATDVLATMNGTKLTIRGVMPEPYSSTMTIYVENWDHINTTIDFSTRDIPEVASVQYQVPGGGLMSATGTIQIATVSPYLSGTFSFTAMDSTKVTNGSFSAPTPN